MVLPRRDASDDYIRVQTGTRALGAGVGQGGKIGTVVFPTRLQGTPMVLLSKMAGSSSVGRAMPLRVERVVSGSFQWRTTGSAGTFSWIAFSPQPRREQSI